MKFYASLRLDVRRIESIKDGDNVVGNRVKIKVAKNKMAPPFKEVLVSIIFGKGISPELDLLDVALERGVIKQSGAWFSFGAEKIGQGRDTVAENLKSNSKLFDAVKEQALAAVAVIPARVTSHQEENV